MKTIRETYPQLFAVLRAGMPALRSFLLFAMVSHAAASSTAWSQPTSDEYHVKAAFLFHFAQLVEWPSEAVDGSGKSLFLCTLDDDAFYDELENTIQGKQIGERTIRIRHIHISQANRGCNILFISKRVGKANRSTKTLRDLSRPYSCGRIWERKSLRKNGAGRGVTSGM